MLTIQESASASGNSAPANPYDDQPLLAAIDALANELRKRAVWLKEHTPGAIRVDMRANVDIGSDGKNKSPFLFTIAALVNEADCSFEVRPGNDWYRAAMSLMTDVQKHVAYERFQNDIAYVPAGLQKVVDESRDRRERLEIEHQDGERFENSY